MPQSSRMRTSSRLARGWTAMVPSAQPRRTRFLSQTNCVITAFLIQEHLPVSEIPSSLPSNFRWAESFYRSDLVLFMFLYTILGFSAQASVPGCESKIVFPKIKEFGPRDVRNHLSIRAVSQTAPAPSFWLWVGQTLRRHSGAPPSGDLQGDYSASRRCWKTKRDGRTAKRWNTKDTSQNSQTQRGACAMTDSRWEKGHVRGLGICTCKFFQMALRQATRLRVKAPGGPPWPVKSHKSKISDFAGLSQMCVLPPFKMQKLFLAGGPY